MKQESAQVVNTLKSQHYKIVMLTGDVEHTSRRLAELLEIEPENVHSQLYPHEKKKIVQQLQQNGESVLFVGDGINDGPVLA